MYSYLTFICSKEMLTLYTLPKKQHLLFKIMLKFLTITEFFLNLVVCMRGDKIVYNEECADRQFFQRNHYGEICWLYVNHRLKELSSVHVVHVGWERILHIGCSLRWWKYKYTCRIFFPRKGIWGGRVQNPIMIEGGGPGAKHQNTSEVFEVLK